MSRGIGWFFRGGNRLNENEKRDRKELATTGKDRGSIFRIADRTDRAWFARLPVMTSCPLLPRPSPYAHHPDRGRARSACAGSGTWQWSLIIGSLLAHCCRWERAGTGLTECGEEWYQVVHRVGGDSSFFDRQHQQRRDTVCTYSERFAPGSRNSLTDKRRGQSVIHIKDRCCCARKDAAALQCKRDIDCGIDSRWSRCERDVLMWKGIHVTHTCIASQYFYLTS